MEKLSRVGMDTSKSVFVLHGVNEAGQPMLRKKLHRQQVLAFFAGLEPTRVGLEACGGAHYWARELRALGHEAVLLPPQYVKPYVKRGKNDAADAGAICEAMSRPGMRFVPVKTVENQAALMLHGARDLLLKQRTMLVNAFRAYATELGMVATKGTVGMDVLLERIAASTAVPELARKIFALMAEQIAGLDQQLKELDRQLLAWHRSNECSRQLAAIPGVGPITATALVMKLPDPSVFRSGRHFAAWIGLTPKDHSSGGRQRLGGITRAGDETLRRLLVSGAMAVIRRAKPGRTSPWLLALLQRKSQLEAGVALANKTARIAWAMMARGETYRRPTAA